MFGNIKEAVENHAREQLVHELATTGEAHLKKVGTWKYDRKTKKVSFEAAPELQAEVAYRVFSSEK